MDASAVWRRLLAGYSPRRATHFLCWCKESKPRKHLGTPFLAYASVAALQPVACEGSQSLARQCSAIRAVGIRGGGALDMTFAMPIPNSRCLVRGLGTRSRVAGPPRPTLMRRSVEQGFASPRTPPARSAATDDHARYRVPRCFLCFLSLHQQRKGVGRGAETPASNLGQTAPLATSTKTQADRAWKP